MANAVVQLLNNPVAAATLAHRAHELVGTFSWRQVRSDWLNVFDKLLPERS
jgi:hypothetical protein